MGEPGPVAPTTNSRCCASSIVFAGAVCQPQNTLLSSTGLPIQWNLRASNFTPSVPSAWSMAMPWLGSPIMVPSCGPTLASVLASRRLPAPGMFCTMTVGFPGM